MGVVVLSSENASATVAKLSFRLMAIMMFAIVPRPGDYRELITRMKSSSEGKTNTGEVKLCVKNEGSVLGSSTLGR